MSKINPALGALGAVAVLAGISAASSRAEGSQSKLFDRVAKKRESRPASEPKEISWEQAIDMIASGDAELHAVPKASSHKGSKALSYDDVFALIQKMARRMEQRNPGYKIWATREDTGQASMTGTTWTNLLGFDPASAFRVYHKAPGERETYFSTHMIGSIGPSNLSRFSPKVREQKLYDSIKSSISTKLR